MKETIQSSRLQQSYRRIQHSSGLEILLYPMADYQSAYALFATKYGSIDTTFKTQNDADFITVPEGVAHFLEHKLFENEDGSDTFAQYAETGASANAYTTFDHTAYLFECTDNFKESLEILLKFVSAPYFTPETVAKEQGIIGQEIDMYLDNPSSVAFYNMMEGLYQEHPARIRIIGTKDSIAQIDDDILYRCYHTFYNLHNMVLVVAGNFTEEDVLAAADAVLSQPAEPMEISRSVPEEPYGVASSLKEETMFVSRPLFQLGFKYKPKDGRTEFLTEPANDVALEIIAGESSPLYRKLYDQGLINSSFACFYLTGRSYAVLIFQGESDDPTAVQQEIYNEIQRLQKEGVSPEVFQRNKNAVYGAQVRRYDNVSAVASHLLDAHLSGATGYDQLEATADLTLEQVENALNHHFDPALSTLSVVYPKKEGAV